MSCKNKCKDYSTQMDSFTSEESQRDAAWDELLTEESVVLQTFINFAKKDEQEGRTMNSDTLKGRLALRKITSKVSEEVLELLTGAAKEIGMSVEDFVIDAATSTAVCMSYKDDF